MKKLNTWSGILARYNVTSPLRWKNSDIVAIKTSVTCNATRLLAVRFHALRGVTANQLQSAQETFRALTAPAFVNGMVLMLWLIGRSSLLTQIWELQQMQAGFC